MQVVTWREAEPSDRAALPGFRCARRDRPWEREVQSGIRRLRPWIRHPQTLLVGLTARDELSAVVLFWTDPEDSWMSHIQLIAVDVAFRQLDGELADSTVDAALEQMVRAAIGAAVPSPLLVSANVHERNGAARRLFARHGFSRDPDGDQPPYEQWLVEVRFIPAGVEALPNG